MPIDARTSGVYKVVSKILTADGSEIGKVVDSTGRIIYEASRLITVTGVPPISFTKSTGKPLVSWDLLGNAQQTGTPSPDNIIMPTFCGVRTAQLIPYPFYSSDGEYAGVQFTTDNGRIIANGTLTSGLLYYLWRPAKFPAGTYTMSVKGKHSGATIYFRDVTNGVSVAYIYGSQNGDRSVTFTLAEEINAMVYVNATSGTVDFDCTIMLNAGEEALPFEPTNGHKIPFNNHGDNLFDKTATDTSNGYISSGFLNSNGEKQTNQRYCVSEYIPVSPNRSYTLLYGVSAHAPSVCFYDSSKNFISGTPYNGKKTVLFTAPQNAEFLRLSYALIDSEIVMLNTGSTAKPYSPYFSETVPVYLGQTPTVRRVKKLVLTGEETIPNNDGVSYNSGTSTDRFVRYIPLSVGDNGTSEIILCTHLGFQAQSWAALKKTGCCIYCSGNTMQLHLRFDNTTLGITQSDTNEQRTEKLKAYIAAQYAAGTPVTVWYVLATPTTGIVNEPLAKIGDYADELHSTDAGVTIPTAKGNNTLTVDTDLQPSSMTITYKGKQ